MTTTHTLTTLADEFERRAMDEAIAAEWPERWAKANDTRPGASKRRNNLRKLWRYANAAKALRAAYPEARCGNCINLGYRSIPVATVCEADSDFYGYQPVNPTDLPCPRWSQAAAMLRKAIKQEADDAH